MRNVTVAIVDDHPIVCEGLAKIVSECEEFSVIGVAVTASEATALTLERRPDLLILDLNIPGGGMSVICDLARQATGTRIVVLSMSEAPDDVIGALRLGAAAYVLKGTGGAELCAILRAVAEGGCYVTPHLAARLIAAAEPPKAAAGHPEDARMLSKREAEIYALVRQGCCNKDIGRRLSLSEKTVKHYLTNMFKKLEVRNRTELALHAPWI
ncbi:response regulator transcription factor [Paracoccus subflavus]|uniref:Response regulator transcription factor n=1 Tax=Paracoccus subflavus TaxID=2528244 RepID=A0A4Q9G902_9RHOB|nr:response regulator transcription factor [Paracoccus subflavus]TBN41997.1 response regulator transcription factor [Paracoccus subflavus]